MRAEPFVAKQVWREEAIEKGIEKGRIEGIEERGFEIARAMFADGDSPGKIARVTGIPLETLKEKLRVQ